MRVSTISFSDKASADRFTSGVMVISRKFYSSNGIILFVVGLAESLYIPGRVYFSFFVLDIDSFLLYNRIGRNYFKCIAIFRAGGAPFLRKTSQEGDEI
jgi:hypothetical protein